ncbi:MAG: crotonobetainyl-CoA:carnitine CoA-transferase CaiB-like acyl-CoA transferase [Gammaproteobacteria bacterium]|jgi:crotonobetainyl-CoA:carnitine CoA-transferase CaiB-like acyl-CoA transferase
MKLAGVRVLDLSRFLPGPYIGLLMADHGAEVIKIESFDGEPTRHLGPKIAGFSAYFRNTQRGKLSLRLNLKSKEGLDIFLQLADQADVVIDSFRPGVVDRLGIGYAAISKRNPRIIYCSLSAFGQEGSLAQRPSHDMGAQALTGTLSLLQQQGRAPSLPASPTADVALGSLALVGILMALYRREKSGDGDFIDMSMTDALMSWNPHIISTVLAEAEPPELANERLYGGAAFYNVYRTADDRYLVLSGAEMNFVENLLNALKRPDLIEVCKLPWGPAQDPVKEFLTETFATRSLTEWDEWLSTLGICYAPVLNLNESWQQDYWRERGMISVGGDGIERLDSPVRFKHEPAQISDKLSELGADTESLLERLGYDAEQRQALKDKGVC